jgi:hypothetical protein
VGTYRFSGGANDELLGAPRATVPRRVQLVYAKARQAVLDRPDRKESWAKLGEVCTAGETYLAEYRKKPGSSKEPFSLRAEGRFAQEIPASPAWKQVEKLFQP